MKTRILFSLTAIGIVSWLFFAIPPALAFVCETDTSVNGVFCSSAGGKSWCNKNAALIDDRCKVENTCPANPSNGTYSLSCDNNSCILTCNSGYTKCGSVCTATVAPVSPCSTFNTCNNYCAACVSGYSYCSTSHACVATQTCQAGQTFNACSNACEGSVAALKLAYDSAAGTYLVNSASPVLTIPASGFVGIGTTSANSLLTIGQGSNSLNFTAGGALYNSDNSRWFRFDNLLSDSLKVSGNLHSTGGILALDGVGNSYIMSSLGIGKNPGYPLDVKGVGRFGDDYPNGVHLGYDYIGGEIGLTDENDRIIAGSLNGIYRFGGYDESQGLSVDPNNGYVGIGNTSPTSRLTIGNISIIDNTDLLVQTGDTPATASLTLKSGSFISRLESFGDDGTLAFNVAGQRSLYILGSNGYVGLGTLDPNTRLHISDAAAGPIISLSGLNANYRGLAIKDTGNSEQWFSGANNLNNFVIRRSGTTDNFTIASTTGYVGIGTTNPVSPLDVVSGGKFTTSTASGSIRMTPTSSIGGNEYGSAIILNVRRSSDYDGAAIASVADSAADWDAAGLAFLYHSNVNGEGRKEAMRISSYGNIGIGTTAPTSKLQIASSTNVEGVRIITSNYSPFVIRNAADTADIFRIDQDGNVTGGIGNSSAWTRKAASSTLYTTNVGDNVGIGLTAPTSKLHVVGDSYFNGNATATGYVSITGAANSSGNLRFSATNPYISAPSYIVMPGGLFVSGGTPYFANSIKARGGIANDSGPYLTIAGGTSTATYFSGSVGIGTTGPTKALQVVGDIALGTESSGTGRELSFNTSGGGQNKITFREGITDFFQILHDGSPGNPGNLLKIRSASTNTGLDTDVLTIQQNGNVGIGTTTPGTRLTVIGSGNYSIDAGNFRIGNVATPASALDAVNKSYLDSLISAFGSWKLNGSDLYASSTSWNVGIGTTDPQTKLHVNAGSLSSTVNVIRLGATWGAMNAGQAIGFFGNGDLVEFAQIAQLTTDSNNGLLTFSTKPSSGTDTERMRIDSSGNVGIGTTNPGNKLEVAGAINSNSTINGISLCIAGDCKASWSDVGGWELDGNTVGQVKSFGTLDNYAIPFLTNGAERMRLTEAGNLVLGATSTGVRLHVVSPNGPVAFFQSKLAGGSYAGYLGNGQSFSNEEFGLYYSAVPDTRLAVFNITDNALLYGGHLSTDPVLAINNSTNNVGIGTTTPTAKLQVVGNANITRSLAMGGDINMGSNNILAVNKLTVTTIDPLYNIKGVNYSTFASAIAGGVKEEYVGRIKINKSVPKNEYEAIVDFDKVVTGSDLWVWRKVVDFAPDNVQVLTTPYGGFAEVYYKIEGNRLIFRSDRPADISYRLIGKRLDWRQWPTKAVDQKEKASLVIN